MDMDAEIKAMLVSIGSADIDEALLRETVRQLHPARVLEPAWSPSSSNQAAIG